MKARDHERIVKGIHTLYTAEVDGLRSELERTRKDLTGLILDYQEQVNRVEFLEAEFRVRGINPDEHSNGGGEK